MIDNFDDICLWMYVIVDDLWQQISPLFKRSGPNAECSELLTLARWLGAAKGVPT